MTMISLFLCLCHNQAEEKCYFAVSKSRLKLIRQYRRLQQDVTRVKGYHVLSCLCRVDSLNIRESYRKLPTQMHGETRMQAEKLK